MMTLLVSVVHTTHGVANEALACGLHAVVSSRAGCARDLEGMNGVFLCEPTLDGLSRAMVASRAAWSGYISNPEILKYSSATQADEALLACRVATAGSSYHGR